MRSSRVAASFLAGTLALVALPDAARAESVIKNPGDHPDYRFEAEPHGLLGFGGPFEGGKGELGAGFRGTVIILDNGFIKTINNSVGIGFGADVFFRKGTVFIPVVMQWNFWLTTHWSVFGEPGVGLSANPQKGRDRFSPTVAAGARYHFNDRVALTLRLGYPSVSVGASFFF